MGAPLPFSVLMQQPQQGVPLDRSTKIGAGAVAVVTPTLDINWATGKQLTRGSANGYNLASLGGYQTFNFRKNFWVETETLPAVGTNPYVMFWLGWPQALGCNLGTAEAGFVVGSSNNTLGICTNLGSNRSVGNSPFGATLWGGSNNTWSTIWSAGEALPMATSGAPFLLMMVRKSNGTLEFWRNGVITNIATVSITSVPAFKLEVGTFVAQSNWNSANNTVLAGLSILSSDPTNAELQAFSANPWSLFKTGRSPSAALYSATLPVGGGNVNIAPGSGGLTATGFAPSIAQSANQWIAPASGGIALQGYAPTVAQTVNQFVTPGGGALTLQGFAPTVAQTRNQFAAPGSGAIALQGFAPTITQSNSQAIQPGSGAINVAGKAPTVSQTANQWVNPTAGALSLTGFAPTITQSASTAIMPAPGTVALTGYAPTIAQSAHQTVQPFSDGIALTGFAPTVVRSSNQWVTPSADGIGLEGFAPTVTQSPSAPDPRYARPVLDVATGGWAASAGASLAAAISEQSPDSSSYIEAAFPSTCEIKLAPVADPNTSGGQVVRYKAGSSTGDGLTVRLKQGAIVIAEWTHQSLPQLETVFAQALTPDQCDSITDYADLRFEFEAF